jgi:hypothetical protein
MIRTRAGRVLSRSMSSPGDTTSRSEASAHRRWIIGIAISVVFGTFGAVMAVLAYRNASSHTRAGGATETVSPRGSTAPAAPAPEPPGHGKGRGK